MWGRVWGRRGFQRDDCDDGASFRGARLAARRSVPSVTGRPRCDDETPPSAAVRDPRRRRRSRRLRLRRRPPVARSHAARRSPCGHRPPCACWCSSASTCCSWPSARSSSPPSRRPRRRHGSASSRCSAKSSSTGTRASKVYRKCASVRRGRGVIVPHFYLPLPLTLAHNPWGCYSVCVRGCSAARSTKTSVSRSGKVNETIICIKLTKREDTYFFRLV